MISYSKHITIFFFMLLFSCSLKAQIKSSITRLEYCYNGEDVTFIYNFKNASTDSISFIIESKAIKREISITFKKNSKNEITLHGIGHLIIIKYSDCNKKRSRNVNLLNYQCNGKSPSKYKDDK